MCTPFPPDKSENVDCALYLHTYISVRYFTRIYHKKFLLFIEITFFVSYVVIIMENIIAIRNFERHQLILCHFLAVFKTVE
jgi:hypothetical protein